MDFFFTEEKNQAKVHKEMETIEDQLNTMERNLKVQTERYQSLGLTARNSPVG